MTNAVSESVASQVYQNNKTEKTDKTNNTKKASYGKTVGEPQLSKEAEAYYEKLKAKYHGMEFVLVSKDMKETAKAQAGKYANPSKMVVLIDEEKIEKMATDKKYREQYEAIIANASSGLAQMKSSMGSAAAEVKGYGMQVNDGGVATYFAVLKKSSADQKARIEKKAAAKKEAKKAEDKKAKKKEEAERLKGDKVKDSEIDDDDEDTITITAGSLEELMQKISDYAQNEKMNNTLTEDEKMLGQHIDFKG